MKANYTTKTLQRLRLQGCEAEVVERWIPTKGPGGGVRRDLFGIIDIIALPSDGSPIIGVQSTSLGCRAPHLNTILQRAESLHRWQSCGGRMQLWCWRKLLLKRGGKALRWRPRIEDITVSLGPEGYTLDILRRDDLEDQ